MAMVNTFVYSILLYGCETWTLEKESENRLEVMWVFKRIKNKHVLLGSQMRMYLEEGV